MDVYEAALVDGAGQTFRYITLPHLRCYIELPSLGTIHRPTRHGLHHDRRARHRHLPYVIYQSSSSLRTTDRLRRRRHAVVASLITATFALRTASTLLKEENS